MSTSSDGSVFEEKPKDRDPSRVDMYFGEEGFDGQYGHVTETRPADPDEDRTYHFARDAEGATYVDDSPRASSEAIRRAEANDRGDEYSNPQSRRGRGRGRR